MKLESENCYQALMARDPRFDGRFFVGVASTGVYCRPVCPTRAPLARNCTFYPSAAAAEGAGFRPCLRCRPELAPGHSSLEAGARLATTAAGIIEEVGEEVARIGDLATRLGVTDRHLRRAFHEHYGVSPHSYTQTQRLLLAKRLLTDTRLPIIEVALASGFGSLSRFNAVFKQRYGWRPSELRKNSPTSRDLDALTLPLAYRPPLDWARLLDFLGRRSIAGVEEVDGSAYRRAVRLAGADGYRSGWIEVRPGAGGPWLELRVAPELPRILPRIMARVKRLFDLSGDPATVAAALGDLAAARPGLRVPGAFDGFELAVRAVLGQQITVQAARTLARRFVTAFGPRVVTPYPLLDRVFPEARAVAELTSLDLSGLGIMPARANSILALARAVARGRVRLDPEADIEETTRELAALPGFGDWTVNYVAMRALAWPDAFPAADVGLMRALGTRRRGEVAAAGEKWRPWRSYAVMHLWASLEE